MGGPRGNDENENWLIKKTNMVGLRLEKRQKRIILPENELFRKDRYPSGVSTKAPFFPPRTEHLQEKAMKRNITCRIVKKRNAASLAKIAFAAAFAVLFQTLVLAGTAKPAGTVKSASASKSVSALKSSSSAKPSSASKSSASAKLVKPATLEKDADAFSYVPFEQLTLKADGRVFEAGSAQPYTGYSTYDLGEAGEVSPRSGITNRENVRHFDYFKDGKPYHGEYRIYWYLPERSVIVEVRRQEDGYFLCSVFRHRDNVKTEITGENFFEMKDKCFYLSCRIRERLEWSGKYPVHLEFFDENGKRIVKTTDRRDGGVQYETVGGDGIFRKFTLNRKTGKLDGGLAAYHPNGRLFYETVYTEGKPGSIVELYDPAGKKIFRLYFETNAFEEPRHTSSLTLVEEWDEEKQRFVDRDTEHFNMFIRFCHPEDELIPAGVKERIDEMTRYMLSCVLQMKDFDTKVDLRELFDLDSELEKVSGEQN